MEAEWQLELQHMTPNKPLRPWPEWRGYPDSAQPTRYECDSGRRRKKTMPPTGLRTAIGSAHGLTLQRPTLSNATR
jgi:hypothetical protein